MKYLAEWDPICVFVLEQLSVGGRSLREMARAGPYTRARLETAATFLVCRGLLSTKLRHAMSPGRPATVFSRTAKQPVTREQRLEQERVHLRERGIDPDEFLTATRRRRLLGF